MTTTALIQIRKDTNAVLREAAQRFKQAWKTGKPQGATFTFSTAKQLFQAMTPERWELLEKLQTIGPISLYQLAEALGQDAKSVHENAIALREIGLVECEEGDGVEQWVVPYDVIHLDVDSLAISGF